MALIIGGCLSAAWVAIYIFSWLVMWAWAWVDDKKADNANVILSFIMIRLFNFDKAEYGYFIYQKGAERSDGVIAFNVSLLCFFLAPILITALIDFNQVTLFIVATVLLAFLARYTRRHKKLFDLHIKDKAAHSQDNQS